MLGKKLLFIYERLLGISKLDNFVQELNAKDSIFLRLLSFSNEIVSRLEQPSNAETPIETTPLPIITFVRLTQ